MGHPSKDWDSLSFGTLLLSILKRLFFQQKTDLVLVKHGLEIFLKDLFGGKAADSSFFSFSSPDSSQAVTKPLQDSVSKATEGIQLRR